MKNVYAMTKTGNFPPCVSLNKRDGEEIFTLSVRASSSLVTSEIKMTPQELRDMAQAILEKVPA